MKCHKICATLLLATGSIAMSAQSPAPPAPAQDNTVKALPVAEQATREDILKLFDAMHLHTQLESMIGSMNMQLRRQLRASMQKQPAATSADAQAKLDTNLADAMNIYPVSEMMDDMVPIYQRHVSKTDVAGIVAFYGSPAGQHLLTESPLMMRESMAVLMPKANARMEAYVAKKVGTGDPSAARPDSSTGPTSPTVAKPSAPPAANPPK